MTKARKRLVLILLLSLLAAGMGVGAVLVVVDSALDPFDDRRFDAGTWAAGDRETRRAMARDAVRRIPAGMTEAEVVSLLGEPGSVEESQRLTRTIPAGAVRTFSYYLGGSILTSYRGLDDALLWVHLGADGRVIAAVIGGG